MSDDVVDWKLAWARWWLYIAVTFAILLVIILAPFWVTLTVIGFIILIMAANKYIYGRWWL